MQGHSRSGYLGLVTGFAMNKPMGPFQSQQAREDEA